MEPLWGTRELLRYLGIAVVGAGFGTCVLVLAVAALTPTHWAEWREELLHGAGVYGCAPLLAALSVAGKQLYPEHPISEFLNLRVKTLPALLGSTHLTAALLGFSPMRLAPTLFALALSWLYLRFVQLSPATGLHGDASDHFSLASFFPEALRPLVERVTGRSQPPVRQAAAAAWLDASSGVAAFQPVVNDPAVDRRRLLAQTALEQRLREKRAAAGNTRAAADASPNNV